MTGPRRVWEGAGESQARAQLYCTQCIDALMTMQAKLGVPDEQFAKWKFAFVRDLQKPEYLEDDELLASRFPKQSASQAMSQDTSYLGLEHEDTGPKHGPRKQSSYTAYERPVKIWG